MAYLMDHRDRLVTREDTDGWIVYGKARDVYEDSQRKAVGAIARRSRRQKIPIHETARRRLSYLGTAERAPTASEGTGIVGKDSTL